MHFHLPLIIKELVLKFIPRIVNALCHIYIDTHALWLLVFILILLLMLLLWASVLSFSSLWLHESIWIHHLISVLSALLQFVELLFLVIENWSRLLLILTDSSNFEFRWWNLKKFWNFVSTLRKINCLPSTWMFIALLFKPNLITEAFLNHFQTVISYFCGVVFHCNFLQLFFFWLLIFIFCYSFWDMHNC